MSYESSDEYEEEEREHHDKSEHEEWLEDDNARRYREWQSDNRSPY